MHVTFYDYLFQCEFQELINEIQTNGLGTDDPNLNTEDIVKETVGMQKQLLDLRMDKNSGSNNATGQPAQLKKYESLFNMSQTCSPNV